MSSLFVVNRVLVVSSVFAVSSILAINKNSRGYLQCQQNITARDEVLAGNYATSSNIMTHDNT